MAIRTEHGESSIYANKTKISVVIPTKNRPEDLKRCLESLLNQSYPVDEIVIVDSSSDDGTEKLCGYLLKRSTVRLIYVKQNAGLAFARNIGNKMISGDIVLNIEDDIFLHVDFIKEIVAIFVRDINNEIGGVGGIEMKDENIKMKVTQFIYKIFGLFFLRDSLREGSVTIAGHPCRLPRKFSQVYWIFNAAYRKEVLKEFSYDEHLEKTHPFAYYDDFDFSYRVSKKYKLILNPKAQYIHKQSFKTHYHAGIFKTNSAKIQNHYYLVKKLRFSRVAFWWSTFGLILCHAILSIGNREHFEALRGLVSGIKNILHLR
jgi:glycosyltransferase involved in cell wall biosynthesis